MWYSSPDEEYPASTTLEQGAASAYQAWGGAHILSERASSSSAELLAPCKTGGDDSSY